MDRQNGFFRQGFPGADGEMADTATPRDRIDTELRNRIFAEEDGIFRRGSVPAAAFSKAEPSEDRRLLRQIADLSLALAHASLYLDTHPNDSALADYHNTYKARLTEAIRAYERES